MSKRRRGALTCRAFGHSWDQIPATRKPPYGVYIWHRCIHCHTIREDIVAPWNGELRSRRYDYSEDFEATRGPRRYRADFRVEYLKGAS